MAMSVLGGREEEERSGSSHITFFFTFFIYFLFIFFFLPQQPHTTITTTTARDLLLAPSTHVLLVICILSFMFMNSIYFEVITAIGEITFKIYSHLGIYLYTKYRIFFHFQT